MKQNRLTSLADGLYGAFAAIVLRLLDLRRRTKRGVLILADFTLLSLSLWIGYALRYRVFYVPSTWESLAVMVAAPVITIATFFHLDLYRRVTRYIGGSSFSTIGFALSISVFMWATVVWLTQASGVPRLAAVLYVVIGTCSVWAIRQLAGWILRSVAGDIVHIAPHSHERKTNIVIYGAGVAGKTLSDAMIRSSRYDPVGFVDTDPTLWGQYVGSLKVFRPDRLPSLVQRYAVQEILLALPSAARAERQKIIRSLEPLKVAVRTLPSLEELADGQLTVRDLRPIGVVDLLGREPVAPLPGLLESAILGKSIMVTGAGGSIGSEIVRQCLQIGPARLVLFEVSENALYTIGLEVDRWLAARASLHRPVIVPVLASVTDTSAIERAIRDNGVHTIYHAAAYKHVPMVEANPAAGLVNNTFGTVTVARASQRLGVERFVCISTDKAVRPTNVMGASKRLAEMMLQALASDKSFSTVITMVRFGNVLGSSGSVVPLFRQQIEAGGPVTVTHRQMVRYFMSIPEAALLVLQAGAMAKGGEVFVLDMGEPVKIDDLARSMIRLAGLSVRDEANPGGDIEITYVGLRPGEKLYEELFLGNELKKTPHPRIMSSLEPLPPVTFLEQQMGILADAIEREDMPGVMNVLSRLVEGFRTTSDVSGTAAEDPSRGLPVGLPTVH